MKIFLVKSLCKRCPFSVFKQCHYKKELFKKHPKYKDKIKVIHKCLHYRNIFKKGQYVFVDLYDQVRMPDGKWEYIVAFENVLGVVKGIRGSKYIIELFEAVFLTRKKRGCRNSESVRLFLECTRAAKDIRPLIAGKTGIMNMESYSIEAEQMELMLS